MNVGYITYYIPYNNHTTLLNNQSIIHLTNDIIEHYNTFYSLTYIVTNILQIIANYILIYTIINYRYLFNYILLKYLTLTLPILSILLYKFTNSLLKTIKNY